MNQPRSDSGVDLTVEVSKKSATDNDQSGKSSVDIANQSDKVGTIEVDHVKHDVNLVEPNAKANINVVETSDSVKTVDSEKSEINIVEATNETPEIDPANSSFEHC